MIMQVPGAKLDLVKRKEPNLMVGVAKLDVPLVANASAGRKEASVHQLTRMFIPITSFQSSFMEELTCST